MLLKVLFAVSVLVLSVQGAEPKDDVIKEIDPIDLVKTPIELVPRPTLGIVYQRLCEQIKHLKRDYTRFLQLHKDIIAPIGDGTNGPVIMEANSMWQRFAELNALICELEEKKKAMAAGILRDDDPEIMENFMQWTGEILRLTADLFEEIGELRAKNGQANNVAPPASINELEKLFFSCLEASQDLPIGVLVERSEFFLQQPIPLSNSKNPYSAICRKLRSLQALCSRLLKVFQMIREELKGKFGDQEGVKYPSQLMYDFCKCVFELCRLVNNLRRICEMAEDPDVSAVDIEKEICDWIVQAMEVRESLRNCLESLASDVSNSLKVLPKRVDGKKFNKKKFIKECFASVKEKVAGILAGFDKCVREIRCIYVEIVTSRLTEVSEVKDVDEIKEG